jgi:hypothetical protein
MGTPKVTLTAVCNNPLVCTQLQTDVLAEQRRLQDKVNVLKWYPVAMLGFGYRF